MCESISSFRGYELPHTHGMPLIGGMWSAAAKERTAASSQQQPAAASSSQHHYELTLASAMVTGISGNRHSIASLLCIALRTQRCTAVPCIHV